MLVIKLWCDLGGWVISKEHAYWLPVAEAEDYGSC